MKTGPCSRGFERFERNWPELEPRYGERFYRLWKYIENAFLRPLRYRNTAARAPK